MIVILLQSSGGLLFCKAIFITAIQSVLVVMFLLVPMSSHAKMPVVLKVGATDSPLLFKYPFNGKAQGLFPEVLEDIAGKENWQIQYVPCVLENCFDKLRNGEIDLLMPVAVSDKRRESFDYNSVTLISSWGQIFTTKNGIGAEIDSLMELNGTRIAVVKNNIYADDFKEMIARFGIKASFVELNSYTDIMTALESQEADAGVGSSLLATGNSNLYDVRSTSIVFSPVELRLAAKKGKNLDILSTIDRHLQEQFKNPLSEYHRSIRHLHNQTQKSSLPVWVKAILFSVCLIVPLFFMHLIFMRKLVDAKTKDLQLEIADKTESQQELQFRNSELTLLEEELRYKLYENRMICEALRVSKNEYKKVFNDAPVGILQTAVDGKLLKINPAIARMFGYATVDEMCSLVNNISETYLSSEQRARLVRHVLASGGYVPWEDVLFLRKDGSTFVVSGNMRAVHSVDGDVIYLEGFLMDVTERQQAEHALKESEQNLRLYVQSLPLSCIRMDADYVVKSWNSAAEQLFGHAEHEAVEQPIYKLIVPRRNKEHSAFLNRVLEGQLDNNYINEYLTKDGRTIICEWTFTRFFNSQGEVRGIIAIAQDITAKRQADEFMVQTEKMMMIGGLAAGLAHEINNPMGIIVQNVQNITRRLSSELCANHKVAEEVGVRLEQVKEYLEKREIFDFISKINSAGQRTSKIVANMLQFSHKTNPGRQPVNLAELSDQVVEMVSKDYDLRKKYDFNNIRLVRDYDPAMPLVPVNVIEWEQVLINLLKNAAQAMVEIPPWRDPEIRLSLRCEDDTAVIQVADNGPGMPEEVRKRLFEPFYTTKEVGSGTGLGLYVSYVLITRHARGVIEVDSAPMEGACFTIRLPLS